MFFSEWQLGHNLTKENIKLKSLCPKTRWWYIQRLYITFTQTGKWWENITRLSAQHRCCLSTVSPWSSTWPKVFGPKKMCSFWKQRPNIKMVDEAFNKFVVFPQPIGIWHRQGHLLRESFTIVSDTILSIQFSREGWINCAAAGSPFQLSGSWSDFHF